MQCVYYAHNANCIQMHTADQAIAAWVAQGDAARMGIIITHSVPLMPRNMQEEDEPSIAVYAYMSTEARDALLAASKTSALYLGFDPKVEDKAKADKRVRVAQTHARQRQQCASALPPAACLYV
jgi:hypothetical protein